MTEQYKDTDTRTINKNLGGEILDFFSKYDLKPFRCSCGHRFRITQVMGYPHDGGLQDAENKRWWVFIVCPRCGYEWSFHKIPLRIQKETIQNNIDIWEVKDAEEHIR